MDPATALEPSALRVQSSIRSMMSTRVPSVSCHSHESICHSSFRRSFWNDAHEDLGRFLAFLSMNPRLSSTLQIVASDGTASTPSSRSRCQWIVAGPASRPSSESLLRIRTIFSSVSALVRLATVNGALERSSRPLIPSASHRFRSS